MSFQSSPPVSSTQLWRDGLWNQNPALVKLLGLCPLLAVSNTATNGLGLGLATLITLLVANGLVSALRQTIMPAVRIPVYVLIIASTVTTIEFLIQAYLPALHTTLGIFLPLIVTNCLIMARSEAFASRQRIAPAIHDALAMGTGFMIVLVTLGALREFIGQGTLLADATLLFGESARHWTLQVYSADHGMLLALLPPGAFIGLGLMLAVKNFIDQRRNHSVTPIAVEQQFSAEPGSNPTVASE